MHKKGADKEYLIWEKNYKKKVLLYLNYAIGVLVFLEAIASYKKLICWEHTVYFTYLPFAFVLNKLFLTHLSTDAASFINAIVHHVITYITVCTKNNYISVIMSFMGHYQIRSVFLSSSLLSWIDTGIITTFFGLTLQRMLDQLYDQEGNCVWEYELLKADISDACFRVIMFNAGLFLADYFTKKKVECLSNLAREIVEKSKEKERFFACISHELRNPLNSLLVSVELLTDASSSKQKELLSTAKSCGESLMHLIGNILDVTKINDKKMELFSTDIDIIELINRIIMMHKYKADNKGLIIEFIGDPYIPPCIKIDSAKMTQILTNLISNSIKFTEKGSIIIKLTWKAIIKSNFSKTDFERAIEKLEKTSSRGEIMQNIEESTKIDLFGRFMKYEAKSVDSFDILGEKFGPKIAYNYSSYHILNSLTNRPAARRERDSKEKGVLKIEIIDTGIGISDANVHKLFHPFAQADKTISQNFGGTGLGLWISKSIAEMMGGCIKIESELGHGANFMVVVPLFSGSEEAALKQEEVNIASIRNEYRGYNILYVEDISENQIIMCQIFAQLGFAIHQASDGAEGLYQFKRNGINYFDLILTDLRMPNMSGQTMIMKIREIEEKQKIRNSERTPIIVLTGDPSEKERSKCLNILKANQFLTKPVSLSQLHKSFQSALQVEEGKEAGTDNKINQQKKKILLIEDDKLLNNLVTQLLENYEVISAYSNQEGMERFEEYYGNIFAICLDGNLPDGTGADYMVLVRELEKEKGVQNGEGVNVVSLSGDPIKMQRKMYKNLFVSKYLVKPFTKDELLNALLNLTQE